MFRPHHSRPSPTPITSRKGGCPKESQGLKNVCPRVIGTLGVGTYPPSLLFIPFPASCFASQDLRW